MPIYNRDLSCWLPVNPTDFVTSDEEYDDTYDFDYPSDSDTDFEEEEEYECLYSRRGEQEIQAIWNDLPKREAASSVIQRWWRSIH